MDQINNFFSPTSKEQQQQTPQNQQIAPSAAVASSSSPTLNDAKVFFNRFQSEAKSVLDKIENSDVYQKIGPELDQLKKVVTAQAERFADEKIKMLRDFENEKKQLLVAHLSKKLAAAVTSLLNIVVVKLKVAIDDPYMPRWIKNLIDTLIDSVYPDVAEDIKEEIFSIAHPSKPVDHGASPYCYNQCACSSCCGGDCCCSPFPKHVAVKRGDPREQNCCTICCCGLCYPNCFFENPCHFFGILAWLRYSICPYDKTFWRQLRDPSFWIVTMITMIPKYGISQLFYMLWFIFGVDKTDEFQLLAFIKSFKCLQFITLGVVGLAVAGAQLFICLMPSPDICMNYAPREELFALFLFCSQIFLVWIAYFCLSCAKNKGGLYHQLSTAKAAQLKEDARNAKSTLLSAMAQETVEESFFEARVEDTESRRRLGGLLIYDTICFAICAGLVVFVSFFNVLDPSANIQNYPAMDAFWESKNYKYVMALYFIKTLSGLLSFPFLLLQIPGVSSLFSHAKPTGYNPWGNTVPFKGAEQDDVPWRVHASDEDENNSKHEAGLMSSAKSSNTKDDNTNIVDEDLQPLRGSDNNNNNNNTASLISGNDNNSHLSPREGGTNQIQHIQVMSPASPVHPNNTNQPQWGGSSNTVKREASDGL